MSTVPFLDAVQDVSAGNTKIPQSAFLEHGQLAIVDQGQQLIAGYTNDAGAAVKSQLPVIVFGDHTRALKFIDFPFVMGADGVKVLRVREGLDPKYVYRFLQSRSIPSAGYSRHYKFLKEISVPKPPLTEQRRIAAILDHTDALRTKRRQVLTKLDALTQSIFHDMFGTSTTARVPIGSFAEVRSGSTPSRADPENFGGSIPWVKTTEVQGGTIRATSESVTEQGAKNARLKKFPVGSVVVAMYGQGKTRGQSAILGIPATTNQACAVIAPNDSFDPAFLQAQLAMSYVRLRGEAEGGNQPNLSLGRVSGFEVLLPTIELQRRYTSRVDLINAFRAAVRKATSYDDQLFASLQSRAFRGEL